MSPYLIYGAERKGTEGGGRYSYSGIQNMQSNGIEVRANDPAGYYIIDNLLPSQSSRNTGNKVNNKGLRVLIDRRNPTDTLPLISDLDIASHMDARRLEFMCETSSLMKL